MKKSKPFIFNPAEETKDSLIQNFVIRLDAFKTILDSIRSSAPGVAPEHFLVIGQRGMGKTTLLLRIKYQVQDEPQLQASFIPIKFSEEQYQISNLVNLWEETAISLAAAHKQYKDLPAQMLQHEREDDYEQICFSLFTAALKKEGKRVILLIDNIGNLFNKLTNQEAHQLRATLMTSPYILLIGGSAQVLEHTFSYDKPFFEFFHQIRLQPLQKEDTIKLMSTLAEQYGVTSKINSIIQTNPERIEVLRRITGGVPRTMVLLFEILADSDNGAAFEDLEELTDRVSPLYTSRMDSLKPQQQKIIDTLARAWEPISAKELLEQSRLYREGMQSNQVSSQLKQLEDNQLVEVVDGEGRKKLYRIRERFFNIWYLMRYGRKSVREQVEWLVRFLQAWCTIQELHQIANDQISCLEEGHYHKKGAYYKAIALNNIKSINVDIKRSLLEKTETFLVRENKLDWAKEVHTLAEEMQEEPFRYKSINAVLNNNLELAEQYLIKALDSKEEHATHYAGNFYLDVKDDLEKAEYYYKQAIEQGYVNASRKLATVFTKQNRIEDAELTLLEAIKLNDEKAFFDLAFLYDEQEKLDKAEEYYLKAIDQDDSVAMYNLAIIYYEQNKIDEAEKLYLRAIKSNQINSLSILAILHKEKGNTVVAEEYKASALKLKNNDSSNNLNILFDNQDKINAVEEFLSRAIFETDLGAINNLALLLSEKGKLEQAERLFLSGFNSSLFDPAILYNLFYLYKDSNRLQEGLKYADQLLNNAESYNHLEKLINIIQSLVIIGQYNFLLNKFQQPDSLLNKYLRPYYYVLAFFIKDKLPGVYEQAGAEIKETVDEIIKQIQSQMPKKETKKKKAKA